MNAHTQEHGDYRFVVGLLAGTCVGAGLMMWLAPRMAAELRQRMTDSARNLGQRASDQYRQASTRVVEAVDEITRKGVEAVDEITRKGQGVRDEVVEAVVHGAHEVERYATATKSDRVAEFRKN